MATNPDRWERVDALFAAALERAPDERRAWLDNATGGDRELIDDVEGMLRSLETAERLIGESAEVLVGSSGPLGPIEEPWLEPGTPLGAYAIVRSLGRGGMGDVYAAQRADRSIDRLVAIKVVRSDVVTPGMARRFAAERRILAGLEHPNIARLYDAGVSENGRPFLVMEHVEGVRIDRYVHDKDLDLRARFALFESVCGAVAFAHQRFVVHRDLKPANILVTEEGRVVLLDFGVARLLGEDEEEGATRGARMLTPEYASPEQLRGDAPTAAMDVYALGVILHELLTGARPSWQRQVIERKDPAELEALQAAPSATLRRQGAPAAVAASELRGDIDTIILTALAANRGNRYASAEALRDDIRRYRTGFPIRARPQSLRYRAAKFVRRNAVTVAMSAVVFVLALGYVATVTLQARRLAAERDRVEANGRRADQVARVLVDMFGSTNPFNPGRTDTMQVGSFLATASQRVDDELRSQPAVRGAVLTVLGRAMRRLGRNDEARALLVRADSVLRDSAATAGARLAETLNELGQLSQDEIKRDEAERYYREALSLVERSPDASPAQHAGALSSLGAILMDKASLDSAAVYLDSAAAVRARFPHTDSGAVADLLNVRGMLHYRRGEPDSAMALMQRALTINRARLGNEHPRVLLDLGNLAFSLTTVGRSKEAIDVYRESIAGLKRRLTLAHPTVVEQLRTLSAALSRDGQRVAAESTMREAVLGARQLGAASTSLSETLDAFGQLMERLGRPEEAEPAYEESRAINRRVYGDAHPLVAILGARLGNLRCQRATTPNARSTALASLRESVAAIDGAFAPPEPVRLKVHSDLGLCMARAGNRVAARTELESNFDAGVKGRGPSHPMVQLVGRALVGFHEEGGDSTAAARVRATLATPAASPPAKR